MIMCEQMDFYQNLGTKKSEIVLENRTQFELNPGIVDTTPELSWGENVTIQGITNISVKIHTKRDGGW